MSLITRCPACVTMFKVVPDQLRVSDGWVRCGQCGEVFDANANLHAETVGEVAATTEPTHDIPQELSKETSQEIPLEFMPAFAPMSAPASALTPPEEPAVFLVQEDGDFTTADADANLEGDPDHEHDVEASLVPPYVDAEDHAPDEDVEHSWGIQPDATPSVWSKRWVRATLILLSTAFGVLLALQWVVQERDRIVATEPATTPALEMLCAVASCQLAPLRQIESVVIESSSFTKLRTDVYRLSFSLKNTALTTLATPAIELTLTDIQDQAVVRRVLLAGEFGSKQATMEPGAELQTAVVISVKLPGNAERISGYRLLSFYP